MKLPRYLTQTESQTKLEATSGYCYVSYLMRTFMKYVQNLFCKPCLLYKLNYITDKDHMYSNKLLNQAYLQIIIIIIIVATKINCLF